ncbi:hypothetical protein PSH28_13525, partial [Pseudomonas resinovorans]|uniref:hypothetical protein n=1 Tax=Metapseudomonas resinovorans TaxID=53412 RepID=UPI00237F6E8F
HQGAKVAFNVQSAVDGEHGLILHHAVGINPAPRFRLPRNANAPNQSGRLLGLHSGSFHTA